MNEPGFKRQMFNLESIARDKDRPCSGLCLTVFMGEKGMTISKKVLVIAGALALLGGCATSTKVQVIQPGDNRLSCAELKDEVAKLDKSQAEINAKKGVTGTNVAAALFWLPGLAYTYYDAGDAERLISERRSALTGLSNNKNCTK